MYACFAALALLAAEPESLNVLPLQTEAGPTRSTYRRAIEAEANAALARRTETYEALKTPEQIAAYQRKLREFFFAQLGPLPERTPLNPQIVGRRDGDGFRMEKVIFESRPKHYVTALLFLPATGSTHEKFPGVIVPCGHTADGKAGYQRIACSLARNGIAALVYDPIGQGERYQILKDDGKPWARSTSEHSAVGIGSILVGRNTASFRIWDGIRALDYLQSRDDIDGTKLGCTGISGGGTLTEYLMALDDRIVCAAPGCATTSFARRIATEKIGDAEQNIFGQIAFGLDHADYIHLRAPKPTLLLCPTQDFVDIRGCWDVFREAKRIYARLGYSERVDLQEADEKHGFPEPLRTASVRWMRRWLLGKDDAVVEQPWESFRGEDVLCTPRGQAQLLDGAKSVMDFNVEAYEAATAHRRQLWKPENREAALEAVRARIGLNSRDSSPKFDAVMLGRIVRPNYVVQRWSFNDGRTPTLIFKSEGDSERAILYLHGDGKQADAAAGGPIDALVKDGATVIAVDLTASGEIGFNGSHHESFLTYLLGESLVGRRTRDVLQNARQFATNMANHSELEIIAVGAAAIPALHAVALDPKLCNKLTLRNSITSWLDVVRDPTLPGQLPNIVHGALLDYDLPDLVNSLPAGKVVMEEPITAFQSRARQ
jgi:dienelactone hydrolase